MRISDGRLRGGVGIHGGRRRRGNKLDDDAHPLNPVDLLEDLLAEVLFARRVREIVL